MSSIRHIAEDCFAFRSRASTDPVAIARTRDSRLRRVIRHAAQNVPYYQKLFSQAGVDPRDIRTVDDLRRLPVTSKETLQDVPLQQRLTRGFKPQGLVRQSTSGSTGMPMVVLRTRLEEAFVLAYQLRSQLLFDVPLRARRAKIGKTYEKTVVHQLGILPMTEIDAIRQTPEQILEAARRWRPDCIDVRPGVLEIMVRAAERDHRKDWPWRWMVSGGEVLYPDLQERAERVFSARMLERYGAHEVGQIAWRCLDCGFMHTNDDSVIVEVLRDGKPVQPGETGEVVVTGLLSYTMPFVRFRLGDLAEQGPTRGGGRCRFGFGQIRAVQGRQIDNLTLADGVSMPTYGLMSTIRQMGGVRRFQILQESFDRVRVLYVPEPGLPRDPGPELERRLQDALPASVGVTTEAVTQIAPDGSGKYRYVRSLVSGSLPSSRTPQ